MSALVSPRPTPYAWTPKARLFLLSTLAVTAALVAAAQAPAGSAQSRPAAPPARRVSTPPLPSVGFAPVRPVDVVRATYDFAAQHPEVLRYVPCFCGCGMDGHKNNEMCFVARRDASGNVLQWDTHGFGCAVCVDVAREAMQLHASGASVTAIRAAIDRKWGALYPNTATPTPRPPGK